MKKVLVLYPKENYILALSEVGIKPIVNINEDFDGLLLTGGGDIAPCAYNMPDLRAKNVEILRDQIELYYVKKCLSKNKPIFGICRGLQVVNVFFGGSLYQHIDGHIEKNADKTHLIYNHKNYFTYNLLGSQILVNSAHHQAVKTLGENLKVVSVSADKIIEAMQYKNIILTQFHPERMPILRKRFFEYFLSLL